MAELDGLSEVAGNGVVLDKDVRVFQRVTPESSAVFLASGILSGTEVEIGGPEKVGHFFFDHKLQYFVPWEDSGERDTQYLRLVDLPAMARMILSPVSKE